MNKIKLIDLKPGDFEMFSNAITKYAQALQELCNSDNRSQQYIHLSIAQDFGHEILKRLIGKEAQKPTLSMAVHTAFVFYDALDHYSHQTEDVREAAVIRRVVTELFSLLPFTKDHDKLSLMSDLNFNQ